MSLPSIVPNYSKSQRIGVLLLLLLIFILQGIYYVTDFSSDDVLVIDSDEMMAYQKEIDSLKLQDTESRKPKIYPFNPSFITDYKGYKLGMTTQEIDRLLAYRKKGKFINSTKQFQQITGVSDSLLTVISPYFKFPDWVTKKKIKQSYSASDNKNDENLAVKNKLPSVKQDLNTATEADLIKIYGIGNKLAQRIIKYRAKLKGYMLDEQLYEVWYLDKEVANRVLQHFTVISKPEILRINVNTATFKEVLHAPYLDYELTKKIFEYRDEVAEIQELEELKKIDGFPVDKFDRISLYLTAE
jgi:DNA uptake protein ComE-like DNA-binding protein